MVARVTTVAFEGIEARTVDVQVQLSSGIPVFTIVGLPDKAVAESRERVRAAIHSLGLALPAKRIVVNLAPADILKEGSHFDLPIAIGILVSMGVLAEDEIDSYLALGELALDASLLPVSGVLPAAMLALEKDKGLICPKECGSEAVWSGIGDILAPSSLLALINHFKGTQVLTMPERGVAATSVFGIDMAEVRGQYSARRALEVAAAGGHNMLMIGAPGAGKSMLASCLPSILPLMDSQEILEVSMINSIAGKLAGGNLSRLRPFRDPHHSASPAAMVGGGKRALPGEISLAHNGVLFLDELPEFPRAVLESLRQPLETGTVSVARAQAHVTYPARFQLIAAMNPCRCGYLGDESRACNKAPRCAADYQGKISGPLLDRFDMVIEVPEVSTLDMLNTSGGESSAIVAKRISEARELQKIRFRDVKILRRTNSDLSGDMLRELVITDEKAECILKQSVEKLRLSMRGYSRVLRVARTIADLEKSEIVRQNHVAEAVSYRQMWFGRQVEFS
ncbi:MAG: YifB family Mg chelatase-like AAA ATPase [Rickettsiales bacterium]